MVRLFTLLFSLAFSALQAQAIFLDIAGPAGVRNTGRNYGIAFGDFDNDGLEDIYVSRHNAPNLLYKSLGNNTFIDVAAQAGVAHHGTTTMSIWGDIDNDGFLDLYLGNRDEPDKLYRNNGDGTFTDITAAAGIFDEFFTKAVMFGDVDNDGFIDLYIANLNAPNALYRNNGNLTFTNIVNQAGVNDFGVAMGSVFIDYDNDGDLDIYLTHDANQPNILYRNNGNLTFTNVSAATGANHASQAMGVDFADINHDGHFDFYITNLSFNSLLLNNGAGLFSNIAQQAGCADVGMGWGVVFFDYDNDGYKDIYMSNDSYFSPHPNILYRNNGDNTFSIVSQGTALHSMYGGYGVACGDVNGDGWLDLMLANSGNDGNQLFLNQNFNINKWVKVKLTGTQSNRAAIGARIRVTAGGKNYIDEVTAGSGYAAQNSFTQHFGLGQAEVIDSLHVRWPSGLQEVFTNLDVNRTYYITEGESISTTSVQNQLKQAAGAQLFANAPNPFGGETLLSFHLEKAQNARLSITDLHGRTIAVPAQGRLDAGLHTFTWDAAGRNLAPGVYLYRLETEEGVLTGKMVLQR